MAVMHWSIFSERGNSEKRFSFTISAALRKGDLRGNEDGQRLQHTLQEQVPAYRNRHCTTR